MKVTRNYIQTLVQITLITSLFFANHAFAAKLNTASAAFPMIQTNLEDDAEPPPVVEDPHGLLYASTNLEDDAEPPPVVEDPHGLFFANTNLEDDAEPPPVVEDPHGLGL
ncbi:MAG: hypothetical protein QNK37_17360 [Acidobacteriota bacterium]|nr:hypothetical protein [Acidobacteriota bacterium]